MIITSPTSSHIEQIYELFMNAQVSRQNPTPKNGFFEYDLSFDDVLERASSQFSLVLCNNQGKVMGYILAQDLDAIRRMRTSDPVYTRINFFDGRVVYVDQLFCNNLTLTGRLTDAWEHMIRGEKAPGIITAIPEKPWQNQSSTRLAIERGFSRTGILVSTDKVDLRLFAKPYLPIDDPFEGFGDNLIISTKTQ